MTVRNPIRAVAVALTAFSLIAGVFVTTTSPAAAHDDWYQTDCRDYWGTWDSRWYIWWSPHYDGAVHYWVEGGATVFTVAKPFIDTYAANGYQCSTLYEPVSHVRSYWYGNEMYEYQVFRCGYMERRTYPSVGAVRWVYQGC